jgi:hypothetical protein
MSNVSGYRDEIASAPVTNKTPPPKNTLAPPPSPLPFHDLPFPSNVFYFCMSFYSYFMRLYRYCAVRGTVRGTGYGVWIWSSRTENELN